VVPLDALGGIYAAAHRRAAGSDDAPFEPAERLSLEDALRLHTAEAAHSAFMEHEVGMLRYGSIPNQGVSNHGLSSDPPALTLLRLSASFSTTFKCK